MARTRRREYVADLAAAGVVPGRIRMSLLRAVGVEAAPSALIGPYVRIRGSGRLVLGEGAGVNTGCVLDCESDIVLGRNVKMGPNCLLTTAGHALGAPEDRCGGTTAKPITIEEGVWLGIGVIVLPGVTIGRGAVIGPGSVVRTNVPPNQLWSVPAATKYKDLPT